MYKFIKINLSIFIQIGLANDIVDFLETQIDILALKEGLQFAWRNKSVMIQINLIKCSS